ncbi:MAG: hypothetical protein KKD18_05990 [Nanoarchaeota archaeon]|nr:hypothetical protein [Nanoarchaeota archaeon]
MADIILSGRKLEGTFSSNADSGSTHTRVWDESNRFVGEFPILISDEEVNRVVERIMALSPKKIDELWHDTSYIYNERDNNLALPDERIRKIKGDFDFAKRDFIGVITDNPCHEMEVIRMLLDSLDKIEGGE